MTPFDRPVPDHAIDSLQADALQGPAPSGSQYCQHRNTAGTRCCRPAGHVAEPALTDGHFHPDWMREPVQ